jgi:predicted DNA-binding transcriptional regulator AlpA
LPRLGWRFRKELEPTMDNRTVDTKGASEHIGLAESTLERARVRGDGPPYVKLGRSVRYRICDLDRWVAARLVSSTSERVAA